MLHETSAKEHWLLNQSQLIESNESMTEVAAAVFGRRRALLSIIALMSHVNVV